jgi:ABC-type phosphate transport system auxiliary subunit
MEQRWTKDKSKYEVASQRMRKEIKKNEEQIATLSYELEQMRLNLKQPQLSSEGEDDSDCDVVDMSC